MCNKRLFTKNMKKLGKGMFAECFLDEDENRVYSFVKYVKEANWQTDYTREGIALYADKTNPHIPQFEKEGSYNVDEGLYYSSPFYYAITKNSPAHKDFLVLNRIFKKLVYQYTDAQEFNDAFLYAIGGEVSNELYNAIEDIINVMTNYGNDYRLEIRKANLKMDSEGNLILLDLMFPQKVMRAILNSKAKKARINHRW